MGGVRKLVVLSSIVASVACSAAGASKDEPLVEGHDDEESVRGCGVERWSVKTGSDPSASSVDLTHAQATDIAHLRAAPARTTSATSSRIAPTETTQWMLTDVTLIGYKVESDSDFHLVLQNASGQTMIAEIPAPSCVGGGSPFASRISAARSAFQSKFGAPGSSLTHTNTTVSMTGVGFLDAIHGQTGVAPNGIELHPVLSICFGAGCSLGVPGGGGGGSDAGVVDGGAGHDAGHDASPPPPPPSGGIQNVFVIVMENHAWSLIKGSASAPYINKTLLPMGAHAENFYNPPGNHPSEPNYLWLEAGDNLGVTNDLTPSRNHQSTTDHLVTYLDRAGISWKSYQEGISGTSCPVSNSGLYAPKHNPMVFFDDVTSSSSHCVAHVRPYSELPSDLSSGTTARYNFITPDLCNDMHGASGCTGSDLVALGDTWLANEVPKILASKAYTDGGAIFITWDESESGDHPIGMIVLSPFAKAGYSNSIAYTHSSTLRTVQEIFGVTPLLRDAARANDLSDLFTHFP